MKIKLLNKGRYTTISGVKFPLIVDGDVGAHDWCEVIGAELIKFGFTNIYPTMIYNFSLTRNECEVVKMKRCKAIRQGDQMQCVCGLAWDIDDTDLPECRT